MLDIKTGVVIGLDIDGREYKLEEGGFQKLTMVSNKRMCFPTAEIVFSDMSGKMDTEFTMGDGVPLTIKIGRSTEDYDTFNYRVFSFKREAINTTPRYTIMAVLDSPRWILQTWKSGIKDTSANVIAALAKGCGLTSRVDPTADDMIWLATNSRTCLFARDVAIRGYLDSQSAFSLGTSLFGEVRYANLSRIKATGPKILHGDLKGSELRALDQRYIGNSGHGNSMGGYMHAVHPQAVVKKLESVSTLDIKRRTQSLLLSKDVRSQLQSGRIDIGHVNCGNVHDNWENARYQNIRTAMLYQMGVELLINQQTDQKFDLLDPFTYQASDPPSDGADPEENPQYTADYIVTAKSIYVEQGNYYEKIQGYTTGINSDPDGRGSQV